VYPSHAWSYDFVQDRTSDGRATRILTIVDEYTREALAVDVERRMSHSYVLDRLADLFIKRGVPEYIRSDNGSEFISTTLRKWLKRVNVKTLYIEPGSPWENGYLAAKILTEYWR
jgi:putative transposase